MTSNYEHLQSVLNKLREQLSDANSEFARYFVDLERQWSMAETFICCIHGWSEAFENELTVQLLSSKMEVLASEIAKGLTDACEKNYMEECPSKFIDIFLEQKAKIQDLKPEIGKALDRLEELGYSFSLQYSPVHDSPLWEMFYEIAECHADALLQQFDDDDRYDKLKVFSDKLQSLVNGIRELQDKVFGDEEEYDLSGNNDEIDNFLTHIATVIIRMATCSCYFWSNELSSKETKIGKIDVLFDMQHEIDPTSIEFLELSLKFIKALCRKFSCTEDEKEILLNFFFNHILGEDTADYFEEELRSLVSLAIDELEQSGEDIQSFWEDIITVVRELVLLTEVASISEDDLRSPTHLSTKFLLTKIEIFIQKLLISRSTINVSSVEAQVDLLDGILTEVAEYMKDVTQDKSENVKYNMVFIEEIALELRTIYQSLCREKIKLSMVRNSLSIWHSRIVLFKAESSLIFLLNTDESRIALGKDHLEKLLKELRFYGSIVTAVHSPMVTQLKSTARRIMSVCCLLQANKLTCEQMMDKFALSNFIDPCRRLPRSHFPKTYSMDFIDFLLGNLRELLKRDVEPIVLVKHIIEEITLDLDVLRSFLINIWEPDTENQDLNGLGMHLIQLAYEVEHVIDSIEVTVDDFWQYASWLRDIQEEIRFVRMQATKISERKTSDYRVLNVTKIYSPKISEASKADIDELMLGLSDQEELIFDQLMSGSPRRDIVSIVGMPGLGKTTLAKRVYNDPKSTIYFHVRAWCGVSQEYQIRKLLLDILSDVSGFSQVFLQMTDEELEERLRQNLLRKRYLIVMDDLWNIKAWNDLDRSLPDNRTGSRILITSRAHDLTLTAEPHSVPHPLRPLSDDESWELLQMKIFPSGGCPKELSEVGKNIARNCKGLPLAIVAVAGLLQRTQQEQDWWKKVADTSSSHIMDDPQSRCMEILQLSYKHLPNHLKACYLYFGAFLQDEDIPVRKLTRLWIAERIIPKHESQRSEDLAEHYLMDLIHRSLVMVSKRRSNGKVKSCRVHDLLRDLCILKAREENFLCPVTRQDEPYASFNTMDYGVNLDFYSPSSSVSYEKHRLSIYVKRKYFALSNPSGPSTRSLIYFAMRDMDPRCQYDISFIPSNFKLLRVLDLESINMGSFILAGIFMLVHLVYLGLCGDLDAISPSIANLWKLETFLVKGLKGKVILPDTIWSMERLRHIHVSKHVGFNLPNRKVGNHYRLHNLVSLSLPSLSYRKDTEELLSRFPNLRKMKCIFLESWDSSKNYNHFPRLDTLTQLESLSILYSGRALNPHRLILPLNLKELTLSNFFLPWEYISSVGRLQNLEVLKLLSRSFQGQTWDMKEGEFSKLKYMKLDTLNIEKWIACDDPLPSLQQLIICNCKDLEEVPYVFVEIPTLQMIQVQRCGKFAEESVRKIREEEFEGLKIIIVPSDQILDPS
ncbi:hypothetical protein ACH5RR_002874 [Cinchona calisaya]|uniref:Late blight resistance protein homolog R1A-3 n=1 Tax=Cinchona calisaya TaxID=153742 RepID=A0ABD3AT75_9GENT